MGAFSKPNKTKCMIFGKKQKDDKFYLNQDELNFVCDYVHIILPRAVVPRDLDIVPLPPGPFYIKIELFLFSNFPMYIEQNSIAFVPTSVVKCRKTKYCQFVGRRVLNS